MDATPNNTAPVDEPVMVSYCDYECLGYLDEKGHWHEWFSNRELQNVTGWTPLMEPI